MYTNIYGEELHPRREIRHGEEYTQRRVIHGEELHMEEDKQEEGLQLEKAFSILLEFISLAHYTQLVKLYKGKKGYTYPGFLFLRTPAALGTASFHDHQLYL